MTTQIFSDSEAFSKREDKKVNGQTQAFANLKLPVNKECEGCWNCAGCIRCADQKEQPKQMQIPKIATIHQALLLAIQTPANSLDMSDWHKCETTHCRAGWIVTLAGEGGKTLEKQTSTLFAAMQIYKEYSPIKVSPVRFFETNEVAMKDIERCAAEEQKS